MKGFLAAVLVGLCVAPLSHAQGVGGDLFGGTLLKPQVGQWAWYDLVDATSKQKYAVRQAIVDEERVGDRVGYWMEIEVVPEVGYKTAVKALMMGPDYDLESVERLIYKSGLDPAVEIESPQKPAGDAAAKPKRVSKGTDKVETGSGSMDAERFEVRTGDVTSTVWINEDVLPTGVVRMKSPNGEWRLRSYGTGGKSAQSAIDRVDSEKDPKVRVKVKGDNR